MWLTGSYDPALNLLYWTVGNPGPQIDRSVRGDLDNLFTDSVVALDPDTGQRKWHYQFTPNDGHDWDSCQDVVLVDRMWRGQMRKLLLHADRNGHFYVLDRTTGEFLSGTPFVYVNWASGFDAQGPPATGARFEFESEGQLLRVSDGRRRHEFPGAVVQPADGLVLPPVRRRRPTLRQRERKVRSGQAVHRPLGEGGSIGRPEAFRAGRSAGIKAIDPDTGKTMWDTKVFQRSLANGVLATGGQLLFAALRDGNLAALDARSGAFLWRFQTGTNMNASPMSYAVGGRQFVAISAGNTLYTFALPATD